MKRKLSTLSLLMLAFAIFSTGFAQNQSHTKHDERESSEKVTNELPAGWNKSITEVIYSDDFTDGMDDWTLVGEGGDNWGLSETDQAGGEAPELRMAYSPVFLGESRMVSPVINTSGYSELTLSFLHVLDLWTGGGGFWVSIETTSDGGETWNQAWELYWETTDDYYAFEVIGITTDDMGSEDFQFCFKYEDNSDLLDWWAIDNVTLGEAIAYDATPVAITGIDGTFYNGDPIDISGVVSNYGSESISFDVLLEVSDGSSVVFESTKSVSDLAFGEIATVDFDTWTSEEGNFTVIVTTLLDGDENTDNDELSAGLTVFASDYYCIPGGNCTVGDGVTDFAFAGIENYGSGCSSDGYGPFNSMTGSVEIGYTYTVTISSGYSSNFASIWVDFNEDFVFTSDELILTDYEITEAGTLFEVDVMIPANAIATTTTMRVGSSWSVPSSPDPCAYLTYGEFEDYTLEISGEQISLNAGVVSIDMADYVEMGDVTPMATVSNNGTQTITFPVSIDIGDEYSSSVTVSDLAYGEQQQVEFETWNAAGGSYEVVVETALEGDEITDNDMMSKTISVVDFVPEKIVVGEEGTGTWCGWCVRGTVYMDSMAMKFPDTWIGIAVHNGDPMLVDEYDAGIGPYIGFAYPGGIVDRIIPADPSAFEGAYNTRLTEIPPASVMIENQVFNPETGELSFTVTSEFVAEVSDFVFNAVLIEDGVTGTGSGWAQANYYSGGGNGPMGGYEDMPDPVPAEDMVYDHVGRAILGGFEGAAGSLPAVVMAGETHSYTFETTISEDWNWENMEVVGMLINSTNGVIENGTKEHILFTGINDVKANSNVKVYPNPATDRVNIQADATIKNVKVYNHIGQLVHEQNAQSRMMNFNTSGFNTGLYLVKIETVDGLVVESVIIK